MAFEELADDFPELFGPEVDLSKEVLAHFGLVFSSFALLEASLQNCFCVWMLDNLRQKNDPELLQNWRSLADGFEAKAIKATFGSLLGLLEDCFRLEPSRDALNVLKRKRDYFAHSFFREENRNMLSDDRQLFLISEMAILRAQVNRVADGVDQVVLDILLTWVPGSDLTSCIERFQERLMKEALNDDILKTGWGDHTMRGSDA